MSGSGLPHSIKKREVSPSNSNQSGSSSEYIYRRKLPVIHCGNLGTSIYLPEQQGHNQNPRLGTIHVMDMQRTATVMKRDSEAQTSSAGGMIALELSDRRQTGVSRRQMMPRRLYQNGFDCRLSSSSDSERSFRRMFCCSAPELVSTSDSLSDDSLQESRQPNDNEHVISTERINGVELCRRYAEMFLRAKEKASRLHEHRSYAAPRIMNSTPVELHPSPGMVDNTMDDLSTMNFQPGSGLVPHNGNSTITVAPTTIAPQQTHPKQQASQSNKRVKARRRDRVNKIRISGKIHSPIKRFPELSWKNSPQTRRSKIRQWLRQHNDILTYTPSLYTLQTLPASENELEAMMQFLPRRVVRCLDCDLSERYVCNKHVHVDLNNSGESSLNSSNASSDRVCGQLHGLVEDMLNLVIEEQQQQQDRT